MLLDPVDGDELGRLAVAQRDRAGLVEEEYVDVPGSLHRTTREGDDVALDEAVHPRDADRGQQTADGGRDEGDEERDQNRLRHRAVRVVGEGAQGDDRHEEGDRQPREKDVERDLVRRLAAFRPLDERDHAVEERLARLLRHLHDELVGEQARPAGDGRTVAARLADDGGGLARDGGLVHRSDTFDHLAVGRDHLSRCHDDDVAPPQLGRGHVLDAAAVRPPVGGRRRAGGSQRGCLGLPATLGDGLGEVREEHRQPEPDGDHAGEPERLTGPADRVQDEDGRRDHAADLDDEDDRVPEQMTRIELEKRVGDGARCDLAGEEALGGVAHRVVS